jgi:hypothetical protein
MKQGRPGFVQGIRYYETVHFNGTAIRTATVWRTMRIFNIHRFPLMQIQHRERTLGAIRDDSQRKEKKKMWNSLVCQWFSTRKILELFEILELFQIWTSWEKPNRNEENVKNCLLFQFGEEKKRTYSKIMKFLDFLLIKVVLKRIEHVDITPNLLFSAQCLQLCGTTKCGTQKYKIFG